MTKNIYFCGSIRGGQQDVDLYAKIIQELQKYGIVLTEHVGKPLVSTDELSLTSKTIHDRDIAWLQQSDVVVAEVTQPSHGVGYEVGRAVAMGKKILLLFRPGTDKKLSCMIGGAENGDDVKLINYEGSEFKEIIQDFFG